MTIRRVWFVYLLLGVMIIAGIAYYLGIGDKPSEEDEYLQRQLVGRWLVPPHSPDYDENRRRMVEEFTSDGQNKLYFYTDATCTELEGEIAFPYTVRNKIISSDLPNGQAVQSEILSLTGDTLTLRSLADNETFPLVRGDICGRF